MASTGWPALTMREATDAVADIEQLRHWSAARCWCEAEHGTWTAGLVPPPWVQDEKTGEGQ